MIRYKVVTEDRWSARVFDHPALRLKYEKGETVNAIPGTPGIMAFKTRGDAKAFLDKCHSYESEPCMIVKVRA
ncbi:unnamed protein product, partial [marine sediment metagenome]